MSDPEAGEGDKAAVRRRVFATIPRWFATVSPDLQPLLDLIVETIGTEVGHTATLQLLQTNRTVSMAAVYSPDLEHVARMLRNFERIPLEKNTGITGRAFATRSPQFVPRVPPGVLAPTVTDDLKAVLAALDVAGVIAVPLIAGKELVGVLSVTRTSQQATFDEGDLALVVDYAQRAAIAVENSLLLTELEARVEARTRELEIANRDLEAFSYTVAHDLRAPLRAISSFASVLREDYAAALDTTGVGYLERIERGTRQMSTILEALLSLARMTTTEIKRESVDLGTIAGSVLERLRDAEPARTVDVAIAADLSALADAGLVRALFENLLGNAWKFTRDRPAASIEVGSETENGERVFYVRDNGAGFDPAFIDKLFAPFQRLHTAAEFEGSGIGLATAQKIVQRHGGRIWAEGAVGKGATLRFTLPALAP